MISKLIKSMVEQLGVLGVSSPRLSIYQAYMHKWFSAASAPGWLKSCSQQDTN